MPATEKRIAIVTTTTRLPVLENIAASTGTNLKITRPGSGIFEGPAKDQIVVSMPASQYSPFIETAIQTR